MPTYLLIVVAIIFACVLFHKISDRLGIPTLLAFIVLGLIFGCDGVFKIQFDDYEITEQLCSVALIFIMFYGGFGTKWSAAKPVALTAVVLSSAGVVLTAGIVGFFCWQALDMEPEESFLIGAVISSTDAASVFSILRSKRLNLKDNTSSLLEVESGSNDPFSYMLTAVMLSVMNGSASGINIAAMLFKQLFFGAAFGFLIAVCAWWVMQRFAFSSTGISTVFVLAVALLAYSAPSYLGGNGYLSVYIVGIYIGNRDIPAKKPLIGFFDALTGLMQIMLFFLLGLLANPSQMPEVFIPALFIALFLTFVARPAAVFLLMTPFKSSLGQKLVVAWAGLRGAASIVFAIMATIDPARTNDDIFHIIFLIVLFSILFQGSLIPAVSKMLGMIDEKCNVMKTFSDYSEDVQVRFIEVTVTENHPWANSMVRDLQLPPETLIALIKRGEERIAPNGSTVLLPGDNVILSAKAAVETNDFYLVERHVIKSGEWSGKAIAELSMNSSSLIVMVRRGDDIIIPNGSTILQDDDIVVINRRTLS